MRDVCSLPGRESMLDRNEAMATPTQREMKGTALECGYTLWQYSANQHIIMVATHWTTGVKSISFIFVFFKCMI